MTSPTLAPPHPQSSEFRRAVEYVGMGFRMARQHVGAHLSLTLVYAAPASAAALTRPLPKLGRPIGAAGAS